ncbi:MAG TPA: hypothetical protein VEZ40_17575 [Pyrinomonadaceae bacterium]|nr:hypothetical protein [Pyrinomonadaceae bacterium]
MKYTGTLIALLLTASVSVSTAVAQEPTPAAPAAQTADQTAEQAELERKALVLLDEVAGETPALKLVANRIRLQAAAAQLLWPRDQERAREIVNAAAGDLAAVAGGIETNDPQYYEVAGTLSQLRQRMLFLIAERDPKFALEFLRATRLPPPPVQPGANFRQPDQELMLEAQLAQRIAARDPQQALRLAEEVLSRGLSSNLMPLLDQLRMRDPEGASRLAANIAKKLRTANFAIDYEATSIAGYLLLSTRAPENATAAAANNQTTIAAAQTNARRLQLDEPTRRDLVNLLVNAALGSVSNQREAGNVGGLVSTVRQLMPEVERYQPAQAAGVLRRLEGYERRGGQSAREFQQVSETATPDAIIEAAAKASPEMRPQLYRTAAWKALSEGNPDRARQIINQHVEAGRQREQMLKELDQQMFWRAASEGKIEQAQVFLARARSTEERVTMLLQLARATSGKGNATAAVGFLDEAWNLIGGRAKGDSQFSTQLQLAQVYAHIASPRAFEIIEASFTHLNELVAAAAVVDGFGQAAFTEDELKWQEGYLWGALTTQANETLAALAPLDFDRALAAADRLQRPELRLPARLAVARGILSKEGARNNSARPPGRRAARPVIRPVN